MLILGIAGPKRAGKTTLALALSTVYGLNHLSFAAPIRQFVADFLGCDLDQLELQKEQPIDWLDGVTPRYMMQTLGTEWGRQHIHSEMWVRRVLRQAAAGAVVSDVRFPNEAMAIRNAGGLILRVNRTGYGTGDAHASEKPLDRGFIDAELQNDDTPETMTSRAKTLIDQWLGGDHGQAQAEAHARGGPTTPT